MHRLRQYIIDNLSILFMSVFIPLFAIASVVFLIKLATYTAVIQLTIWEMTKLYIFSLPEIIFFTLPIAFFIAAALTLYKLSTDNEIVVLFALGVHPKFILMTLLKPALLLSMLLTFSFFILFPHAKVLSLNFVANKKSEAKFNLSASEFGHSFGEWLLYVGKSNSNGTYGDVFLFNKNSEDEILIGAKNAKVINDNGLLKLKLTDGEGYSYSKDKLSQINFKTMLINDTLTTELTQYKSAMEYWLSDSISKTREKMFITYTLLAIFPIIGLFIIASISIVHVRHQKGKMYLYLILSLVIFFGLSFGLRNIFSYYTIPIVIISWLSVTYYIYNRAIRARF